MAPVTNYSVTCWPGRRAASFAHEVRPGQWGLVLRLDPVDTLITQAPFPAGALDFVRWCRDLSRAAGHLATQVENSIVPARPRHYVDQVADQAAEISENQTDATEGGGGAWGS